MPFAIDRSQSGVIFARIPFFQTVAAMRAVNTQSYPMVGLFGTSSVSNGLFFYDEDETAADDGVTVIKPDYVSGAGRWKRHGLQAEREVFGTVTVNPGNIVTARSLEVSVTITGVAVGDRVRMIPPAALEAGLIVGQSVVSATDTVLMRIFNATAADIDPASATWSYQWFDMT